MKALHTFLFLSLLIVGVSCEQELVDNTASPCPSDDPSIICPGEEPVACPPGATAGSADFSKFIALGSSYTAGFQAGALFTEGQDNSLPKLLATQFACVGGGAFNQPTIGSANGFNIFVTPNPIGTPPNLTVLGRFRLQGATPRPTPQAAGMEAIPNPTLNPSFMYTGDKAALNNFAVQAIFLRQILTEAAGNWANPNPAVGFSPFYARFASAPGTSTILGDAAAKGGTFFMFWQGMDDFMLHAAFGADPTKAPLTPAAGGVGTGFESTYNYALVQLLSANTLSKGVIATFPNIFAMPHFTSVAWNPVTMDATTAAGANSGYAGYNAILNALKGAPFNLSAAEVDARKITFAEGANGFVIEDETLTDYGPYFDGLLGANMITPEQRAALVPLEQVRMTKQGDIIPLATGSVLGTLAVPGNPASVRGVGVPLGDQYALIPSEIVAIETARQAFNTTIRNAASANARLALADVDAAFNAFVGAKAAVQNGVTLTPNINPPTGIYSEDGLHPNTRGYAFIGNIFIDAINAKFGASVPKINVAQFSATGLPLP